MTKIIPFGYEGASALLNQWDDEFGTVSSLFSISRGKGHATEVMKLIVEYADERNMTLRLEVRPFHYADNMSPDKIQLKRFYAKFGFVHDEDDLMVRPSRGLHGL